MRFLTVEQMRAADHAAITEKKIPGGVLMNRAGTALARAVARRARAAGRGRHRGEGRSVRGGAGHPALTAGRDQVRLSVS